jgi:ribosomal protein S18 acetylase RimI-like enzyme
MIKLTPMSAGEYTNYVKRLIPNFAEELGRTGELSKDEALIKSNQIVGELLPRGLETENHFLFNLKSGADDQIVGILYFALQESGSDRSVFIYDIEIYDQFKGKGFGTEVMRSAEDLARDHGAVEIWLHVFANNTAANCLYTKLGYKVKKEFLGKNGEVTSRRMAKTLFTR